jgi:hypothetical protein
MWSEPAKNIRKVQTVAHANGVWPNRCGVMKAAMNGRFREGTPSFVGVEVVHEMYMAQLSVTLPHASGTVKPAGLGGQCASQIWGADLVR